MPATPFSQLPLSKEILTNLDRLGYSDMTPVQAEALPAILEGSDVIAKAKTGSGKTLAFGLGVMHRLDTGRYRVQSLVLCPTRELADQVAKELRRLARFTENIKVLTLCGGMPFRPQLASLDHGAHIVVGTPGRVLKHLKKGSLQLAHVSTLVFDEADRMLDMGFADEIEAVMAYVPSRRQTLLFSATFPEAIDSIASAFMHEPVTVSVEALHADTAIAQQVFEYGDKNAALVRLLSHFRPRSSIVFCNMKATAAAVADMLHEKGFSALAIHGDLEQMERNEVLVQFGNGSCSILVATDVAARGLDIKALEAVVNYDLPRDPEVYIHRIGRTGRAGEEGLALSICGDTEEEALALEAIEGYQQSTLLHGDLGELNDTVRPYGAEMVTLCIDGGRRQKVRPGDILGALTKDAGLEGKRVGKIDIFDNFAYVAIACDYADEAFAYLRSGRIKGRNFRIWKLEL